MGKSNKIDITDESILDLALKVIIGDEQEAKGMAGEICVQYILKNTDEELSDEEVQDKMDELLIHANLKDMVDKGVLVAEFDDDGTIRYSDNPDYEGPEDEFDGDEDEDWEDEDWEGLDEEED